MHPKARIRMEELVSGLLDACTVEKGASVGRGLYILTKGLRGIVVKSKGTWISELGVYTQVYIKLLSAIKAVEPEPVDYEGPLRGLLNDEQLEILKQDIVDYFDKIPRPYEVKVPLPSPPEGIEKVIQLSDDIAITLEEAPNLLGGGAGLMQGLGGLFGGTQKLSLSLDLKGYSNYSLDSYTPRDALGIYKVFAHQGIHRNLFELDKSVTSGLVGLMGATQHQIPKSAINVKDLLDDAASNQVELPINICTFLNKLRFKENQEDINRRIGSILGVATALVKSKEKEALRVRAAIEWAFDSVTNDNLNLSFLQICFGFEALLGEGESKVGLTETLADRCSFLIANSIKGRQTIKKSFKELYRLRSKLVHGVANDLNEEEQRYYYWGADILNLAIAKEIKHLRLT